MARILVAEDDPDIANLLAHYLQRAGFEADLVATGRDVLPRLKKAPPDVLLLDLMLPDRPGLEVLREMRRRDPDAVVVIVTAYSSIEGAIQATRARCGRATSCDRWWWRAARSSPSWAR